MEIEKVNGINFLVQKHKGNNKKWSPFYYDDGKTLHSGMLAEETKIGNYTFKAHTVVGFRDDKAIEGILVDGSKVEIDGKYIDIKDDEITHFHTNGKVSYFIGTEEYNDDKKGLVYLTDDGLSLNEKGNISCGYVNPFTAGKIQFSGGKLTINEDGEIDYIN